MAYEDYVEEITIESIEDLFDYITGRKNIPDLREDFIFRGVKSSKHELIPSSLRKDEDDEEFIIDKFFSENNIDKKEDCSSYEEFNKEHCNKEINLLFNFYDNADKEGLFVHNNQKFRSNINKDTFKKPCDNSGYWPIREYFDLLALAQHYGIPTRALDWSFDYHVALYFSVIGVLEDKHKDDDCVLWAFNYKKFVNSKVDYSIPHYNHLIHIYGSPYYENENLRSQKGIFTILEDQKNDISFKPFDILMGELLDEYKSYLENSNNDKRKYPFNGQYDIKLNGEKVFYKFIIPQDLKAEVLNDLYKEGYTEERIFPGYASIAKSIENKVKLDKLLEGKKSNG